MYNHIQLLLRDWDQHALACFIGEQMMIQPNNTAVHSRAKRIKPSRHRSQVWTSLLWVGPPKAPNELATEWVMLCLIFLWFFLFFLRCFFTFSVWGSFPCYLLHFGANLWFACYLLHFGAKISDLRAICCVFELKSFILHAICSISELKSQIWVANDNCNILVFTNFLLVFNDVWMVFIAVLIVFNDLSGFFGFKNSLGFLLGFLRV